MALEIGSYQIDPDNPENFHALHCRASGTWNRNSKCCKNWRKKKKSMIDNYLSAFFVEMS